MRVLLASALAALVLAPVAGAWSWPVDGEVLKQFVFDRSHPYAGGQHRGIDVAADAGSTVVAPASGEVSFAGTLPTNGKTVTIQTPDGYAVTLVHLGSYSVAKGTSVTEGDAVGTVGPTGISDETVPFVYLGIRHADDPQGYVDPLTLLPDPTSVPAASSDPGGSAVPAASGEGSDASASEVGVAAAGADPSDAPPSTQPEPVGTGVKPSTPTVVPIPVRPEREDANGVDPASPQTLAGQVQVSESGGAGDPVDPPGGWHVGHLVPEDPARPVGAASTGRATASNPATSLPAPTARSGHDGSRRLGHWHVVGRPAAAVSARPREVAVSVRHAPARGRDGMWPGRAPGVPIHRTSGTVVAAHGRGHGLRTLLLALGAALGLTLAAGGAAGRLRKGGSPPRTPADRGPAEEGEAEEARIMSPPSRLDLESHLAGPNARTHPRRGRLAVRVRPPAHRPCRRVRPVGRLRPLPPAAGQSGAHGVRHRRARNARHGHRRPGRRVAA